jgi:hypothetical protein
MPSPKKKPRKPKEVKGKFKSKFLGMEYEFTSIIAGKIVFITAISILFLVHCFFVLRVPYELSIPPFIMVIAAFIITMKFGCNSPTNHEDLFLQQPTEK